ncbi:hypothetical protein GIY21_19850 [Xanthomonas sontii]|uniref:Uncharacterized protein n=1 Tax=Xanthomonas sontii TaxID=2650745 RepID=A0A6N7QHB2_9XANT|nr:hypothetical protein [Xanthomonas sontii]MRH02557.1 hypothetical protein [Xanthomonas sontii]MRH76891.1 hypothetical protein [Xanthomonas sontii]
MNYLLLKQDQMPNMAASIKERVNFGSWHLFRDKLKDFFILSADGVLYHLDESGKIVRKIKIEESSGDFDIYYFSDSPRPESLSNLSFVKAA